MRTQVTSGRRLLIDKYLPTFRFHDYHEAIVAATQDHAYQAFRSIDLRESVIIRTLFAIRSLPSRFGAKPQDEPRASDKAAGTFLEFLSAAGWVIFEEIPGEELVAGVVTQPWEPIVKFRGLPAAEFIDFAEPGFTKIAWNIAAVRVSEGLSRVSTETRVLPTDPEALRRFRRYWFVVSPGIHLVRRVALRLLKRHLRQDARKTR
ncbi:MAG TPA: hypothetical protein VEZ90_05760 [Blastocatellia bacterium]|nr:hypothetical protein [Blastocatellia bacterium]